MSKAPASSTKKYSGISLLTRSVGSWCNTGISNITTICKMHFSYVHQCWDSEIDISFAPLAPQGNKIVLTSSNAKGLLRMRSLSIIGPSVLGVPFVNFSSCFCSSAHHFSLRPSFCLPGNVSSPGGISASPLHDDDTDQSSPRKPIHRAIFKICDAKPLAPAPDKGQFLTRLYLTFMYVCDEEDSNLNVSNRALCFPLLICLLRWFSLIMFVLAQEERKGDKERFKSWLKSALDNGPNLHIVLPMSVSISPSNDRAALFCFLDSTPPPCRQSTFSFSREVITSQKNNSFLENIEQMAFLFSLSGSRRRITFLGGTPCAAWLQTEIVFRNWTFSFPTTDP